VECATWNSVIIDLIYLESPYLLRWTCKYQRVGCVGRKRPTHRARNCHPCVRENLNKSWTSS